MPSMKYLNKLMETEIFEELPRSCLDCKYFTVTNTYKFSCKRLLDKDPVLGDIVNIMFFRINRSRDCPLHSQQQSPPKNCLVCRYCSRQNEYILCSYSNRIISHDNGYLTDIHCPLCQWQSDLENRKKEKNNEDCKQI